MWITSALLLELELALSSKLAAPSFFKNKSTLYLYFRLQLSHMRMRARKARALSSSDSIDFLHRALDQAQGK